MNKKQIIIDKLNEIAQEIQNEPKSVKTLHIVAINGVMVIDNVEYFSGKDNEKETKVGHAAVVFAETANQKFKEELRQLMTEFNTDLRFTRSVENLFDKYF